MHKNETSLFGVSKTRSSSPAFTIVELLVVIVVIGVLAAITVVSYTGISSRAMVASMQSDLSNASQKLKLYQVDNGKYPATIADAINSKLISPNPSLDYYKYDVDDVSNPQYFCYMNRRGKDIYAIDSNSTVSKGLCLTNLVSNGDFSNGSTGWVVSNSSVVGGRMRTYITTAIDAYFLQAIAGMNTGTVMYSRFDLEVATGNLDFNNNLSYRYNTTGSKSIVYQEDNSSLLFDNAVATIVDYYVDNIEAYNLTTLFGAGNEPTKIQMDAIMAQFPIQWFHGTAKANL